MTMQPQIRYPSSWVGEWGFEMLVGNLQMAVRSYRDGHCRQAGQSVSQSVSPFKRMARKELSRFLINWPSLAIKHVSVFPYSPISLSVYDYCLPGRPLPHDRKTISHGQQPASFILEDFYYWGSDACPDFDKHSKSNR